MPINEQTLPILASCPRGSSAPLHSFAFENKDVRLASICGLNGHGQSLAVWRKLDMLCAGHLAVSLLRELESAGITRRAEDMAPAGAFASFTGWSLPSS
jgi:hypothetical protein